ncbi:MAG: hypothetical protein ACKO9Q_25655, partial [Pirellula sp.]
MRIDQAMIQSPLLTLRVPPCALKKIELQIDTKILAWIRVFVESMQDFHLRGLDAIDQSFP